MKFDTLVDIKVIVATHKEYDMPQDEMYLPVHAGAAIAGKELPYQRDDEGTNISAKNKSWCELTALYWAWKNIDADYIGICHYRRYFKGRAGNAEDLQGGPAKALSGSQTKASAAGPARKSELAELLAKAPVILPKKRNYFIETNYTQYIHAHHREDLDLTRQIIADQFPEYIPAWDSVMQRTTGHRFNMMIMRRDLLEGYCSWLWTILESLEQQLDISAYSDYDKRVFGFVAERLLDVWIETNKVEYTELPVYETESVDWIKKGTQFLKRKFLGNHRRK